MSKFNLIAAAALVALLPMAQPALAADGSANIRAKMVTKGDQTLYCYKAKITGSRMARRVCLTEQELAQNGARIANENGEFRVVAAPTSDRTRQN
jgi:hypothetical protein